MRTILLTVLAAASFSATADFTQSGNTVTFDDQWWQVETVWTSTAGSRIVCSGGAGESCTLDAGTYKWLGSSGSGRITQASYQEPARLSTYTKTLEPCSRQVDPECYLQCDDPQNHIITGYQCTGHYINSVEPAYSKPIIVDPNNELGERGLICRNFFNSADGLDTLFIDNHMSLTCMVTN